MYCNSLHPIPISSCSLLSCRKIKNARLQRKPGIGETWTVLPGGGGRAAEKTGYSTALRTTVKWWRLEKQPGVEPELSSGSWTQFCAYRLIFPLYHQCKTERTCVVWFMNYIKQKLYKFCKYNTSTCLSKIRLKMTGRKEDGRIFKLCMLKLK